MNTTANMGSARKRAAHPHRLCRSLHALRLVGLRHVTESRRARALFARVALDTGAGDTAAPHSTTALRTYTGEIDSGATQLAFDGHYALSMTFQAA